MLSLRTNAVRALVILATAGGAVLAVAGPAAAASSTECTFKEGEFGCTSGVLGASADHWIDLTAYTNDHNPGHTNTCRAMDAGNGVTVGTVSRGWTDYSAKTIRIKGLYGRYFVNCIDANGGAGGGKLWHN